MPRRLRHRHLARAKPPCSGWRARTAVQRLVCEESPRRRPRPRAPPPRCRRAAALGSAQGRPLPAWPKPRPAAGGRGVAPGRCCRRRRWRRARWRRRTQPRATPRSRPRPRAPPPRRRRAAALEAALHPPRPHGLGEASLVSRCSSSPRRTRARASSAPAPPDSGRTSSDPPLRAACERRDGLSLWSSNLPSAPERVSGPSAASEDVRERGGRRGLVCRVTSGRCAAGGCWL